MISYFFIYDGGIAAAVISCYHVQVKVKISQAGHIVVMTFLPSLLSPSLPFIPPSSFHFSLPNLP